MLYDISPPLDEATPVYPGDMPFSVARTGSLAAGDAANVSALTSTTHLGAHVDAPLHTEAAGAAVADLPLDAFLGPCRVSAVPPVPLVLPEHLPAAGPEEPRRLLLKTTSLRDRAAFHEDYTALSPAAARELARRGLLLVGLDTPSIDPFGSQDLPAHHALAGAGVVILEGVVLDEVPAGVYELIALPLKLAGLDASPVRAVLRSLG